METSLVRFHTSEGIRLDGLLFEPREKTKRIVIQVHGTGCNFYSQKFIEVFADEITANGYGFLSFNNRGMGIETKFYKENNGEVVDRIIIGSKNEVFEECLFDIQAAVDFVKSKGYKDIVLCGHSYGCNKIVYYALNNKDFKGGLILLAPVDCDGITWKVDESEAIDIENIDMFRYTRDANPKLATTSNDILIQIGAQDKYFVQKNTHTCIECLVKAFNMSKVEGHVIENANHGFEGKFLEVAQNITYWLAKN